MKLNQIAKMRGGQDGVIWKEELFRFGSRGECRVYDLRQLRAGEITQLEPVAEFTLDDAQRIAPHSNSVFWGNARFAPEDEFPLLYSNIYNNYAKAENKLKGVCCVYRLQRAGSSFTTTLVQLIEIGFTEDPQLWKASAEADGPRPYGNFVIDREAGYYYAFVMRNEALGTRYFKFNIPDVQAGVLDPVYGVKKVTFGAADVLEMFDCPYHRFVQGATLRGHKIYSTEGFEDEINRPAIRVIDPAGKTQEHYLDLWAGGYRIEPEMIDFYGDICCYSDAKGNLYSLEV